ncbi:nicotinamidase-like [Ostrea edulis]|uniref:nicotinamidase-like n=1 Tax=Ostrea edulis TaxID=37623 RepID=UPI002094A475|nr:nicotinamidase-like [Ostrea edulis]XP_048774975.1 nicotinamidase-like [Ostrea edulis]XP_048774976.1 nicotinamidase-like [Ostrea edulis]XP_048774977.1 nicotinamidase-like [Ostrea edulis]XP_048774978.1 nicotinamidase-like [Ostrea edulis]XP_048774979.1 nicotinamidase-like [Ostrea edulis]XP_048774981.1 nicotinamidase-like [Ostrea edulis]XP_048774982.1 nicotinamidase-like [Ostrea edulis]XP_056011709.1 nicotinamidase-like [Ostrea edulis]XP_056011710.1 nicotinamidase-like [Ostrea edulis]XP_05
MSDFLRIFALCQIFASVPVFADKIALLVIDVQNCFLPTGNLPVADGDHVIPVINDIRRKYDNLFSLVVFSQDWHCVDHVSFASQHSGKAPYNTVILQYNNEGMLCDPTSQCDVEYNITQVLWPDHCIKNTTTAEFASNITKKNSDFIVKKGYHCKIDSYSAFFDNGGFSHTQLDRKLKENKISTVIVTGLALDYCVFYTAKDAKKLGYNVYVVEDATRGVANSTSNGAVKDMNNRGIHIIQSDQLEDIMDKLTSLGNILQGLNCFWYIVNFVITVDLVHSLASL